MGQTGGAIMMVLALSWPIVGGALVGFVGGLIKRHSLVGTLIDTVLGGVIGFALTMGFIAVAPKVAILDKLAVPIALGIPIIGGLLGLWLKGRFAAT